MQPDFSRDARIASILTRIAQLPKKPRLLITIDGPCGSANPPWRMRCPTR